MRCGIESRRLRFWRAAALVVLGCVARASVATAQVAIVARTGAAASQRVESGSASEDSSGTILLRSAPTPSRSDTTAGTQIDVRKHIAIGAGLGALAGVALVAYSLHQCEAKYQGHSSNGMPCALGMDTAALFLGMGGAIAGGFLGGLEGLVTKSLRE